MRHARAGNAEAALIARIAYNVALALAAGPVLLWKALRDRAFAATIPQRLGRRLDGIPRGGVLVHCASVGEVRAAARIVAGIAGDVVVSVMTPAGLDLARRLFPRATVIAAPLDLAPIVARALDAIAPRLLVIVETELWPELILAASARGVPVALVSARISRRTERAYRRAGFLFGPALRAMAVIGAQTDTDRSRLVAIGAEPERVQVTGNVKLDPAASSGPEGAAIGRIFAAARPIFVAGSTHAGEEAAALDAWTAARIETPDLTLVIAPRHLARLPEIDALLAARGVAPAYRTKLEAPLQPGARVVILDTIGELDALYAHADVAFVGGSLAPIGGHNLLEPARHGRPVLFGPHTDNFRAEADLLLRAGGALRVSDAAELAREAGALIADRDRAAGMGEAGRRAVAESRGATARTLALLAAWLPAERDA